MANNRRMKCGKQILAIGQEGSLADLDNKINECAKCLKNYDCGLYDDYLQNQRYLEDKGLRSK